MNDPNDVRVVRAHSNRAIAARDAELVVSYMSPDVVVHVAGGPRLAGREASRAAFALQFADKNFRGYVREPDEVTLSENTLRATECGRWVGRWRVNGREESMRGDYTAEWERTDIGWLIRMERFEGGA